MKKVNLKFGILTVYPGNVTVIEINSGVQISKDNVIEVIEAAEKNTRGNYALISNRKQAYSTEVIELYTVLSSREKLRYAAIVVHRSLTRLMFDQEKIVEQIVSKNKLPLELFYKLEDAVERAQQYLKNSDAAQHQ